MAKDPAALLYIDKWLSATAEMDADVRGWYLNLTLHQYDKKSLPNDVEKLAVLAGVKFSEFKRFEQVFEQVFKHKFKQNSEGRLENEFAAEVIQGRELFKDKREVAGKISYFIKWVKLRYNADKQLIDFLKANVDFFSLDTKDEHLLKQVFEQVFELYINVNKDINTDCINEGLQGEQPGEDQPTKLFLVPAMEMIWKESFPSYPYRRETDYPALLKIGKFFCEQEKMPANEVTGEAKAKILESWKMIVPFVAKDKFFSGYSLMQVNNHIQSIIQNFRKSNAQTASTNSEIHAGASATGSQRGGTLEELLSHQRSTSDSIS